MSWLSRLGWFMYRLLKSNGHNEFNRCVECKQRKRNDWPNYIFRPSHMIGYDRMADEWVLFDDNNTAARIAILNSRIKQISEPPEATWNIIRSLCSRCITNHFEDK